jgi:hypothetical protein
MEQYDPEISPDPVEWLEMDEQPRVMEAEDFHRRANFDVPGIEAHALIHAIVENQIAEGVTSVVAAMERLIAGGLGRHEALHAVGSVLAAQIWDVLHPQGAGARKWTQAEYDDALNQLTAQG